MVGFPNNHGVFNFKNDQHLGVNIGGTTISENTHYGFGHTVNGSDIPRPLPPGMVLKSVVNNGINYLHQLQGRPQMQL